MNKNEKSPAPMSPAEWVKRVRPEITFSSEALTGMQDYAEYVAEYVAEYMRCRFSEAMDEEVKKYYMSRHAQKRIIEKTHTQ